LPRCIIIFLLLIVIIHELIEEIAIEKLSTLSTLNLEAYWKIVLLYTTTINLGTLKRELDEVTR
jgi:hypothetical protein